MNRVSMWLAMACFFSATLQASANPTNGQPPDQANEAAQGITVRGERVNPEDLVESEPRQVIGKEEIANVLTGKGMRCEKGVLKSTYAVSTGFTFEDGVVVALGELVEGVRAMRAEGRLSCVVVVSSEYDRSVFERIVDAVGTGSVVWESPEPDPPPVSTPGKAQ